MRTERMNVPARALVILLSLFVFLAGPAFADEKKFDVKSASTMADVLASLIGSSVEVTLRSGVVMVGKIGPVQQNLVVITELRGKEFFDAVVRIEDVSAVAVRMRGK